MKNIIDELLKIDAGKLEVTKKECKVDKLSEIAGKEITFTCVPVTIDTYNEIQKNMVNINKKGEITDIDSTKMNIELVLKGVPDLKDKRLLEHFKKVTPMELIRDVKLFTVGDINKLAQTVSELSGIQTIEKAEEEIKNS